MNWFVFALWAYGMALLEIAFRHSPMALGQAGYVPVLSLILLVFVALLGPGLTVMWAAFVLGLLADMSVALPGASSTVLGPHAAGYMLAAYCIMQLRTVMVRNASTTVAVSTLVAGLLVAVVSTTWIGFRKLVYGDMGAFRAPGWLMSSIVESVYTAIIALPIGFVLMLTAGWFGFSTRPSR